jgi:hypothetical protein
MADPSMRDALELMKTRVQKAETEVIKLKKLANGIAELDGLPLPYPDVGDDVSRPVSGLVRADQFTNYTAPSTAARAFLEEARGPRLGAASLEDIFEGLKRGGYIFENRDEASAKNALRIALGKDGQVKKLPNGTYGLIAWYDKIQRDRGNENIEAPPEQAGEGKRARGRPPKQSAQEEPKQALEHEERKSGGADEAEDEAATPSQE